MVKFEHIVLNEDVGAYEPQPALCGKLAPHYSSDPTVEQYSALRWYLDRNILDASQTTPGRGLRWCPECVKAIPPLVLLAEAEL